jgi:hypothetical protein
LSLVSLRVTLLHRVNMTIAQRLRLILVIIWMRDDFNHKDEKLDREGLDGRQQKHVWTECMGHTLPVWGLGSRCLLLVGAQLFNNLPDSSRAFQNPFPGAITIEEFKPAPQGSMSIDAVCLPLQTSCSL